MKGRSGLTVGGAGRIARRWLGVGLSAAVLALGAGTAAAGDPRDWNNRLNLETAFLPPGETPAVGLPVFENPLRPWDGSVVPAAAQLPAGRAAADRPAASPQFITLQSFEQPEEQPGEAAGAIAGGETSQDKQEKLGAAPQDTSQLFLRQATVLLQPGQAQFDWGLQYIWQEARFPVSLTNQQLADERVRNRRLFAPLALRYGVTQRLQAFVNMPVGWGFLDQANPQQDAFDTVFGLGDVNAGFSYLLRKGEGHCPDLVGTFALLAPSGPNPYHLGGGVAATGDGFWNISYDLLFVKALDPAVIFYGVGYKHHFARNFLGGELAPGEEVNYQLGVGLAVNDRLTLSTIFFGAYRPDMRFNGVGLKGTSQEPMSLRLALTAVATPCYIVEPFARFGLTPDAPQADVGVILTRTF